MDRKKAAIPGLILGAWLAAASHGGLMSAAAQNLPPPSAPLSSPSPTPQAPDDPCGGNARLLATLNRPTIGYSSCAVPAGSIVFEEGYQVQQQGSGATVSSGVQYPQSFTRIGIKKRFEVDIIGPYFNKLTTPDGKGGTIRSHGYQDSGLGIKYELIPKGRYTIAVDGLYTPPNGSADYTAGGATQTANLNVAFAATPTLGIATTLAYSSTSGFKSDGKPSSFSVLMPSAVVTRQLPGFYQLYAEYVYVSKLAPRMERAGPW